jgi:drug/metabolite transporter (DMT)-like permease
MYTFRLYLFVIRKPPVILLSCLLHCSPSMKLFLLASALCLMVAVESTTIKFVKTRQTHDPPSEQLVLLVELVKLFISAITFKVTFTKEKDNEKGRKQANTYHGREHNNLLDPNGSRQSGFSAREPIAESQDTDEIQQLLVEVLEGESVDKIEEQESTVLNFMLPACLYAVSNNVTFAALSLMSPAMFNLLMNLKIPFTCFMAALFLSYKLTPLLTTSVIGLFFGAAIGTLKFTDGKLTFDVRFYGVILMIIYSLCSAGAAVYTEYITKQKFPKENMFLQNVKFCLCSIGANVILIALRGKIPFVELEPLHCASIFALGANGILTAAVLKFGGSILKTYAVSVAMFLSALFTIALFHEELRWNFYVGATVSAVAVNLYAYAKKQ